MTLKLYLFGAPQFLYQDKPLTGFVSNKARALLIYLAVTNRAHSRDHLAELLWADTPISKRKNLKKALSNLRNLDGIRLIEESNQLVALDPDDGWVDVRAFAQMTANKGAAFQGDDLARALAMYQDDFLAGFNVSLSYEFEAWALNKQAELRTQFIDLSYRLMDRYESRGELAQAISTARRLLQLEPWREEVHRRLMELLMQDGQRSAALAHFEFCKQVLKEELEIEPDHATVALYQKLQQQPAKIASSSPANFKTVADYTLVGRAAEWAVLFGRWRTLSRPHLVCISGEAGIGKTRLAEELLMLAERKGQPAARARYHAIQGNLAYGPVADWLRTAAFQATLAELNEIWLRELARLLPELLIQHPTLEPPQPIQTSWQRKQLYEALTHTFSQGNAPLLLLLDDLQWSDVDTLEWLQYLLDRATRPLLLVGTVRADELMPEHPLRGLVRQLQRSEQYTELPLAPLTADDAEVLAAQVAGQPLSQRQATALYREMGGNPLFIIERARIGIHEEAPLLRRASTVHEPSSSATSIPPKVYSVLQARLAQLSPEAQRLAQVAATLGRAFDVTLLAQCTGALEADVMNVLDELWQRQIIREVDLGRYDFSHDRVRDVVNGEIRPIIKLKYHRQIARALEAEAGQDAGPVAAELALHYEHGGIYQKALIHYLSAVDAAKAVYAHTDIVKYLKKALAMIQRLPPSKKSSELEADLWFRVGLAEIVTTYFGSEPVALAWEKAYQVAAHTDSDFLRGQTLLGMATYRKNRGQWLEGFTYAQAAVAVAAKIDDPYLQSQIYVEYGGFMYHLGQFVDALPYFDKVFALENRAQTASFEWLNRYPARNALLRSAKALWCLGHADQARLQSRKAMAMLQDTIDPKLHWQEQFPTLDFTAMLFTFLRDIDMVEHLGTRLLEVAKTYDHRFYVYAGEMFIGWALAHHGDPVEGSRMVRASVYAHHERGNHMFDPLWRSLLADTLLLAQHTDAALAEIDFALANLERSKNNFWTANLLKLKGDCRLAQSAPEAEVAAWYQEAIAIARQQEARALELRATMSLARLWQAEDKALDAYQMLAPMYNWFTEGFDTIDLIEAKQLLDDLQRAAKVRELGFSSRER